MPERLHPGVYVEEVPPAVRAIEGVSTSTAAFVGVAECGPTDKPVLVTSFKEYQDKFGGFRKDSFLTYSVLNFFENGGRKCYIVRVVGNGAKSALIELRDRERVAKGTAMYDIFAEAIAEPVLRISASSPGAWGNDIDIELKDGTNDPSNEFKIIVKQGEEALEVWDNLSMVMGDGNYVENILGGGQSQYIVVKRIGGRSDAPGVLISGVLDPAPILSDKSKPNFKISLSWEDPSNPTNTITSGPKKIVLIPQDDPKEIAKDIQGKVRSASSEEAFTKFECRVIEIGSDKRFLFLSGKGKSKSSVQVSRGDDIAADNSANPPVVAETNVLGRLKLDSSVSDRRKQPVAFPGQDLQRGRSKSDDYPQTDISSGMKLSFNLNRDGFQTVELEANNSGQAIADDIQRKVQAIYANRKDPLNENAYKKFRATYTSHYELTFGAVDNDAGTFEFVAPTGSSPPPDLTVDLVLCLRKNNETIYGGSPYNNTGSNTNIKIHADSGSTESDRTVISGGNRVLTDLRTTTNGTIVLSIRPASLTLTDPDIKINIVPTGDLSSGEKIAQAIQDAVRLKETTIDYSDPTYVPLNNTATRQALRGFKASYVAYYTLTSEEVRTDGDTIGPISSVEVLPYGKDSEDAAISLNLGIPNGGTEQNGAAMLRPEDGEYHLGDNSIGGAVYNVDNGDDGAAPEDGDFTSEKGLMKLDKVDDVNLIAIPGRGSKKVISAGLGYAMNRKLQDCFFIGDMGGAQKDDVLEDRVNSPPVETRDDAKQFARTMPVRSDFGAIYFPWVKAPDPIGKGKNPTRYLPPSGYMAGIYARIDGKRGVFKAPAGTEASLTGTMLPALDIAAKIDDTDQDFLNPKGVNVIRSFPASGIVAWGARTMGSDPAWRYIPVRRMAIFLRVSIYNGIQWAVFEPNDEPLWSNLRLNIGAFMYNQFRAGAFQGSTPSEAYFVRCDSSTTTQQDIDNGVVNVLVGFAPLKPAEFVVIKLSQKAGQAPK